MTNRSVALLLQRIHPLLDRTDPAGVAEFVDIARRHLPTFKEVRSKNSSRWSARMRSEMSRISDPIRQVIELMLGTEPSTATSSFVVTIWRVLSGGEVSPEAFFAAAGEADPTARRLFLLELGGALLAGYHRMGHTPHLETMRALISERLVGTDHRPDVKMHNLAAFCAHLVGDFRGAITLCQPAMLSSEAFAAAIGRSNAAVAERQQGDLEAAWNLISEAVRIAYEHSLAPGVVWFHFERAMRIAYTAGVSHSLAELFGRLEVLKDRLSPIDYYDHRSFCTAIARSPFAPNYPKWLLEPSRSAIAIWQHHNLGDDIDNLYFKLLDATPDSALEL